MDEKKEIEYKTNQIFNIIEKPLMEYISEFMNEESSVLFKDDVPEDSDPLILIPIPEYKDNVYLKFTLNTQLKINDNNRITKINNVIKYQNVKDAIGFLLYCIKSALPSIVISGMINNKPMLNINLCLDETNWVFYPKFQHDLTIKKIFLDETIINILNKKQQSDLTNENIQDLNNEFQKTILLLNEIKSQITPNILNLEEKMNKNYNSKPVLAINIEEILHHELPKKNTNKLPIISNLNYEDHPE